MAEQRSRKSQTSISQKFTSSPYDFIVAII